MYVFTVLYRQKQPPEVFYVRKGNFAKFTGKHLCQSIFLKKAQACNFIKKETLAQVFSCEFWNISKNTFFTEHIRTTASGESFKIIIIQSPYFHRSKNLYRSTRPEVFCKRGVLRKFAKFTGKQLCQRLLFRPTTLLKKSLCHKCFPMNWVYLLLQNTSGGFILLFVSFLKALEQLKYYLIPSMVDMKKCYPLSVFILLFINILSIQQFGYSSFPLTQPWKQ